MVRDTHDDDKLSFVTIAAATANALRFLGLDKKKDQNSTEEVNGDRAVRKCRTMRSAPRSTPEADADRS